MKSRHAMVAMLFAAIVATAPALPAQATKPVTTKAAPKVKEKEESQATLAKEAKVSEADALATALKEFPGGKVLEKELEREDGKLIYSILIKVTGKAGVEEVNVDAMTGAIVGKEHEADPKSVTPKAPAKAPAKKSGGGR
jgi:uncharacterized membrane protein YkoI